MAEGSKRVTLFDTFRAGATVGGTLTVIRRDGSETISYKELIGRAEAVATGLANRGIGPRDRVALFAYQSAEFVVGCLAAWRLGATVTSLVPWSRTDHRERWERDTRYRLGVTQPACILSASKRDAIESPAPIFDVATLEETSDAALPHPPADHLAIIQFSSGSTADPKAAAISSSALEVFLTTKTKRTLLSTEDTVVHWLPLFHDMGLMNYLLGPMLRGARVVMFPTALFLARPLRWLELISEHRATCTGGPNFAYGFVARAVDKERVSLDLSSIRWAGNGGEAVDLEALDRFLAAVEPMGFRRGVMKPGYGLAETVCTVSCALASDELVVDTVDRDALASGRAIPASAGSRAATFASVGVPLDGVEVTIKDGEGRDVDERGVGEVVVRGRTLMDGYFGNPQATRSVIRDGWLHTGDSGYLAGERLYITGRLKDMIIIRGRNFYAEDIERVVQRVPGVRKGCSVAFPVKGRLTEDVVVMAETRLTDLDQLEVCRTNVRRTIRTDVGLNVKDVILLEPRTIPKTSSGKLMRSRAKQLYDQGRLHDLYGDRDGTATSKRS